MKEKKRKHPLPAYEEFSDDWEPPSEPDKKEAKTANNRLWWKKWSYSEGTEKKKMATGKKRPLRRREWIEKFVRIRDIDGNIVPLIYNPAQRMLEAAIIRQERSQRPVRQVILKARKMGFSTLIVAIDFERCLRIQNHNGLLVAHDDDTSAEVLKMARVMLENFSDDHGSPFDFDMRHQASYHLAWLPPIGSEVKIASAAKGNPGRGFTPSLLHCSESSIWKDAKDKEQSLLNSLPKTQHTMAFMESTARGDRGSFRDRFWSAWDERGQSLAKRKSLYNANFFPWFWHPGYRWTATVGRGRELDPELAMEIKATLTPHEAWLLRQQYLQRWSPDDQWEAVEEFGERGYQTRWRRKGVGWKNVDFDQLAWRRMQLVDEFNADVQKPETWDRFREEFPSTPQEAFLASGQLVFSASDIERALKEDARDPIWKGTIVDTSIEALTLLDEATEEKARAEKLRPDLEWDEKRFQRLEDPRGTLHIWEEPAPNKLYVVGIDTSGGGANSDFASATVVETASRRLVAAWNERCDPTEWGRKMARLGLLYNNALLAFETHPSQHGLSACLASRNMGYTALYRRQQQGMVSARVTEELGWATTYKTKPLMIDRVRVCLKEAYDIPAEALLRQLLQGKRDEKGEIEFDAHDDFFVSYSIAQLVCDVVGSQGFISKPEERTKTWTEAWWDYKKRTYRVGAQAAVPSLPMYDGV